ncbi:type II toxin-antitoxin system VapC family toxin [Brevundimonas balnearis]|uniref:Ribonuclease VapC n=1 Tax=Brevundimonas balnearis TaxID=1572858 RepID=A0ABV6R437_9CAUL
MIYVDTSVLVAAVTPEPATERVQDWLGSQAAGALGISAWVEVEFAAALRFKVSTRQITEVLMSSALAHFRSELVQTFTTWTIEPTDFAAAAEIAGSRWAKLKGPDALHLAVAQRLEVPIRTLDQGLARAAKAADHPVVSP